MSSSRFRTYLWVFAKLVLFGKWRDRPGDNSVDARAYVELPQGTPDGVTPNEDWKTIPYVLARRLGSFVQSYAFLICVTVLLLFLACVDVRFVDPLQLPTGEHRRQAETLNRRIEQLGAKRADHGLSVTSSILAGRGGDSVPKAVKAYHEAAAKHLIQEQERLQRELSELPKQELEALRVSPQTAQLQGWLSDRTYQIGLEQELLGIAESALSYSDIVAIRERHKRFIETLRESERELLAKLPATGTVVTSQMLVDALDEDPLSLSKSERDILWRHLTARQELRLSAENAIRLFRLYRLSLPTIAVSDAFFTPLMALFVFAFLIRLGTDERPSRVMMWIRRWLPRRQPVRVRRWAIPFGSVGQRPIVSEACRKCFSEKS